MRDELEVGVRDMANALRILSADAVEAAQSGHPGMPLGMADIATVLFTEVLKYDASSPAWPDRDRFVLSNGHGSMLQYSLLHLTGYEGMPLKDIRAFRQRGSVATGHPERGEPLGVETTTGPLGQGVANAVGMALAERLLEARWGKDLVDHRTYAFCGDGCLMEGVAQEAISLAGHLGLSKLTLVFDDNSTTIDGSTDISTSERHLDRFAAAGWETMEIDGHDVAEIRSAFDRAFKSERPVFIAARTRIGFGAPTKEGSNTAHGAPLGAEELEGLRKALGWTAAPFEVPPEIGATWREAGARGTEQRRDWEVRLGNHDRGKEFMEAETGVLPETLQDAIRDEISNLVTEAVEEPTRKSGRRAASALFKLMPDRLFGGSGDLTGSVLSQAEGMTSVAEAGFAGQHMSYGVREHAMASAMNGIAAHGGLVPYGATYLTFCDYCRPAIRLAAMMKLRLIYVFTHDSIGVGEDGPTHQPIEQVMALRAIPGLNVYRPADAVETLECWLDAIEREGPSALILSRQKTPQVRLSHRPDMPARSGAYVLAEAEGKRDATLLATGTEVALALEARRLLADHGLNLAVVSVPCWERFDERPAAERHEILGSAPRFAVEAGTPLGWSDYVGSRENVFGLDDFGLSAPGPEVYEAKGLTAQIIAAKIQARLNA
ncbi:transketolase [Tropicimonas sp. IMCC34011]|uniref:transketolase n=1 Tax=Tropicimonas sp. IMCC34011 TaxID=2248759 RepID=UPI000E2702D6|nr:transketolase [Tropicimonas sp. IMCC34011]